MKEKISPLWSGGVKWNAFRPNGHKGLSTNGTSKCVVSNLQWASGGHYSADPTLITQRQSELLSVFLKIWKNGHQPLHVIFMLATGDFP